jgi:hypothetical protein
MSKMMNDVLNSLQLYRTTYHEADLVDANLIEQSLLTEPHRVSNMLSYVFGTKENYSVLNLLTGGVGRTMTIESNQYQWDLMIEADKPVTIEQAKWNGGSISSTDTPGINGSMIQVWTKDNFFKAGTVVEFDDNNYQARVMSEPYQDGQDWVNTLQVVNGPEAYILPSLLAAGKQLSILGSAYEEFSDEGAGVVAQMPIKLRNHLTTCRLSYSATGSAVSTVMVIAMRDPLTKKSTKYYTDYQQWLALRKWYRELEYQLMYQKYNANADGSVSLKGTNGRPVYMGAGLLEQISPANRRYYTELTTDILDDFLFDLSYNVLGFGERKFVALTGEMGMRELDRILREKASSYSLIDTKFVSGSGQELTLGGQFVTYRMLNGIELSLKHFPLYDDLYHFGRKLHPITGKPVESYRMTFVNYGMTDGESNIQKVVRKGREFNMWTVAGSVAPGQGFANSISTTRATGRDGYTVHFLGECGIMVKNPTTCGELILDVAS